MRKAVEKSRVRVLQHPQTAWGLCRASGREGYRTTAESNALARDDRHKIGEEAIVKGECSESALRVPLGACDIDLARAASQNSPHNGIERPLFAYDALIAIAVVRKCVSHIECGNDLRQKFRDG